MSSIYRKGRDGYYYYQTYVYNPESEKKDKRIFHSLNTKDLLEAKTKQNELDTKYQKQNHINTNSNSISYNLSPKITIAIIVGTIGITILVLTIFRPNTVKHQLRGSTLSQKVKGVEKKKNVTSKIIKPVNVVSNERDHLKKENKPIIKKNSPGSKQATSKIKIPKHTVERVDILSGAFEQGKVYVTINENSSKDSQRLLCKNLTKRYPEFSNIVICLFSNNLAGKNLAMGYDENVSVEEQKQSWLAMYTYNSVEGEYFDDNPSGYLGVY